MHFVNVGLSVGWQYLIIRLPHTEIGFINCRIINMAKTIKLRFVDFWECFNEQNNAFLDALKGHFDVVLCDDPDYIIYSVFGKNHLMYDCIRIFFTGECMTPDFNECDYAIGFDHLQFGDRYARVPLYSTLRYKSSYDSLASRKIMTKEDISGRGFCSFVVSNGNAPAKRDEFFNQLSQYKHVASGGRHLNNVGGPVADKNAFVSQFKFNIAFENSSHDGYVTEKIVDAFVAGVVPIYYGDPRVVEDFNPKAFINVLDYPSFEAAIERVKEIDADDDQYLQMLNEPCVQPNADVTSLDDFLLPIFQRPLSEAKRRSHSQFAITSEETQLDDMYIKSQKIYMRCKKYVIRRDKLRRMLTKFLPSKLARYIS